MDELWLAVLIMQEKRNNSETELACSRLLNEQLQIRIEGERREKARIEASMRQVNTQNASLETQIDMLTKQIEKMEREREREMEMMRKKDDALFGMKRELDSTVRVLNEEQRKKQKLRQAHRVLSQSFDHQTAEQTVVQALDELKQACMATTTTTMSTTVQMN